FAAEQKGVGVRSIIINDPATPIEINQSLLITPDRIDSETWRSGFVAKTMIAATIDIEPYVGRVSPKIDGLDSATCSNLAKRLGPDFARIIVDRRWVWEGFRYSSEKRAI